MAESDSGDDEADGDALRRRALAQIRDSGIAEALWPSNEMAMQRLETILAQLDESLIEEFFPPTDRQGPGLAGLISGLAEQYGLTPAEQRVLINLCNGLKLKEQAEQAGVSHNTLRSQTQRLLEKTGTHSQSELISLVFRHLTSR